MPFCNRRQAFCFLLGAASRQKRAQSDAGQLRRQTARCGRRVPSAPSPKPLPSCCVGVNIFSVKNYTHAAARTSLQSDSSHERPVSSHPRVDPPTGRMRGSVRCDALVLTPGRVPAQASPGPAGSRWRLSPGEGESQFTEAQDKEIQRSPFVLRVYPFSMGGNSRGAQGGSQ